MGYCDSGGSGGRAYSAPRVSRVYDINHIRPDMPTEVFAKSHDIRAMFKRKNGLDLNKSGGSYMPNSLPIYANGTANSGNSSVDTDQISNSHRLYDFGRLYG